MAKIIVASRNKGKILEIKEILSLNNVEISDLNEMDYSGTIEENGKTFRENALIKAQTVFIRYGIPVIADDSGLCVSALDGKPGVYSSRFAGSQASDEDNNCLLLHKLRCVDDRERAAWFTCTAVFYYAIKRYYLTEGRVDGVIAHSPAGTRGFGYDPLFFLPEYGKTMAQLYDYEKNRMSHRALAFRKLRLYIEKYLIKGLQEPN